MPLSKTGTSPDRLFPDTVKITFRRWLRQAMGGLVVLLALAGWMSLLSWSIQDPSLNHATNEDPQNLLGPIGATVSDLLFQSIGLASIAVFLAPAVWGWRLMTPSWMPYCYTRYILWPLSVLALAGAFAALPPIGSWPLPSGLGGIAGDAVLKALSNAVVTESPNINKFLAASLLGVMGTIALFLATGIRSDDLKLIWQTEQGNLSQIAFRRVAALIAGLASISYRGNEAQTDTQDSESFREKGARAMAYKLRPGKREKKNNRENKKNATAKDPFGRIEPRFDSSSFDPEGTFSDEPAFDMPKSPQRRRAARFSSEPPPLHKSASHAAEEFLLPSTSLLERPVVTRRKPELSKDVLQEKAYILEEVLQDFGIRGEIINAHPGPIITLYELEPARGIKSSRVIGLADDIARSMSALSARVAVVPGRNVIGIELPNEARDTVFLREILESTQFAQADMALPLALGKTIGGDPVVVDLARMPHLLIAGTTGSGKSVGINTMILSLIYRLSPEDCKFIMIDPKMLELSVYDGIPHLLSPVVTDPKKAVVALKWTVREMEERYKKMSKLGVRNIDGYNARVTEAREKGETLQRVVQTGFDRETGEAIYEKENMNFEPMPYIVVVVDEMADLMMVAGKEIEGAMQRLAQMARAAGIHLITATQRPSVDVITGTIKANFPTRISFQVSSKIDSRTILGEQGAEQLLGSGDMLYVASGARVMRVHGPFVTDEEIEKIVYFLKSQGVPEYLDEITIETEETGNSFSMASGNGNDLYDQAIEIIMRDRRVSTSYIQRKLSIGYNRAASIVERMEDEGLISAPNSAGKREILIERIE